MININDKPMVAPDNKIEREFNGCKVQLFFKSQRNEKVERMVLDQLMLVFDRKMKGIRKDETSSLPVSCIYQASS